MSWKDPRPRAADTPPIPRPAEMFRTGTVAFGIDGEADPAFVRMVAAILDGTVAESAPETVTVIRIDKWFDHKWLRYSGKLMGQVGFWMHELTLPPFHPRRVKSQTVLRRSDGGAYREIEAPTLHILQPSNENLSRRLDLETGSGLYAWWSDDSAASGRGSVMVYTQIEDRASSWFASFRQRQEWRIDRTKGIAVDAVRRYVDRGP